MEIITTYSGFKIRFSYKPHLVEAVRRLPAGRRWLPAEKVWFVPKEHRIAVEKFAHFYGFTWASDTKDPEKIYDIKPLPELTLDIPINGELRPYQRGGVAYNLLHQRVILGDDMGLGKTLQAIASVLGADILFKQSGNLPAFPCLVICPSSVKYNWQNQWRQWTGRNYAMILEDSVKRNWHMYYEADMARVFIVNYESLKKYFVRAIHKEKDQKLRLNHIEFVPNIKLFNSIIIDESHKIKESKAQQSKFCEGIARGKNYIFELTGTPVINKPKDIVQQLKVLGKFDSLFDSYRAFEKRYCSGPNGASNLKELNSILTNHCFYRRSKQEVAKELPPKSRQIVQVDITNMKEYKRAEANLGQYLREFRNASDKEIANTLKGRAMVLIAILKNLSAKGRLYDAISYIDNVNEQGNKIIVFVHLHEIGDYLLNHYQHAASITGKDDLQARQESIRRFKEDPKCQQIFCSIKAAGEAIDGLQYASSTVAFVEWPWTAAACDQAEDRANRIGQKESVSCTYFLGKETIDSYLYEIIERKRKMADDITGNEDKVEVDFIYEFSNLFLKREEVNDG